MITFFENYELETHLIFLYYLSLPFLIKLFNKLEMHKDEILINNLLSVLFTLIVIYTPINMFILFLFILIPIISEVLSLISTKNSLSLEIIETSLETNLEESKEFFTSYFKINHFVIFIILINLPIFFSIYTSTILTIFILLISLTSIYSIKKSKLKRYYVFNIISSIFTLMLKQKFTKKNKNYKKASQAFFDTDTIVLIIGESLTRNRMSLYDYKRETNPLLSSLEKSSQRLFKFKNVISTNSYTRLVLPKILTFFNMNSKKSWEEYESIIEIYKKLNYKTYWISNQEPEGIFGASIAKKMAINTDHSFFNRKGSFNPNESNQFDEDLIPQLENALNDSSKKKLIILHLMGNHFSYKNRYPEEFNFFKNNIKGNNSFLDSKKIEIYNQYDNSVLYNDFLVSKIFKKVDEKIKNHVCIYLSDHGEEVYENRDYMGHNQESPSRYMFEIPFLLFLSKSYIEKFPNQKEKITQNINSSFISDDLIHFLLNITKVTHEKYKDDYSLINSTNYEYDRTFLNINYDQELKNNNFASKLNKKLWIHRVNSIYKLLNSQQNVHGIEIDIFIEDQKIIVKHLKDEHSTLELKNLLKHVHKNISIWLDIKNLNEDNMILLRDELFTIIKENHLNKEKFILESSNYITLEKLKEHFYVSYYLPYLKEEELNDKKIKNSILSNIIKTSPNGISFPGYMINYVKELNIRGVDLLTWYEEKNYYSDIEDYDYINTLSNDKSVKAILISDKDTLMFKRNFNLSKNINFIFSQIDEINKQNKRVILYGAGTICKLLAPHINNIVGIVDKKNNLTISGYNIESPNTINNYKFDLILITVLGRENEIISYLIEDLKIKYQKIKIIETKK